MRSLRSPEHARGVITFTEAALLGSTLIKGSTGATVDSTGRGCYLGMALEAIGRRSRNDALNYGRLEEEWPWLWGDGTGTILAPYQSIYDCYDCEGFDAAHALAQELEKQYDVTTKQEVPEAECQLVQR